MRQTYKVQYLPIALQDLEDIIVYLNTRLNSPQAADGFLEALDHAVRTIAEFPYSMPLYRSSRPLRDEIRFTGVKNYVLYYVVKDDGVEIRRILHGRRNREALVK